MTGTPDPNTLADELEADARYIDGECKCDLCDIQAGRLRAAARLLRTTNPQPNNDEVASWLAMLEEFGDVCAERDAAIADRDRLLDAIGDPDKLRKAAHGQAGWYPVNRKTAVILRRIAGAAANTTTHPTGDEP